MADTDANDLVHRLATLEGRVARLEWRAPQGGDEDAPLSKAEAACILGMSPSGLDKLLQRAPELAHAYWRAPPRPGAKVTRTRLKFSRKALIEWREAHR